MTILSFLADQADAQQAQAWADRLGISRPELLRDALRRQLNRLAAEEATAWQLRPLGDTERALSAVAGWGPAEDWADWADAAR